jgi:5-methylcytosine-specific restriction endonuclease McrA
MDTLVLSPEYEPINQITWQAAVIALLGDRGENIEVLEEYEDRECRSVTFSIKIPAVIRYISGKCVKKRGVRFSRENVYTRDKGRCQYCRRKVARPEATYDHVVPRAKGGQTRWENIVIACVPCNQCKGELQVSCGKKSCAKCRGRKVPMQLLAKPVKPKYLPETLRLTFTKSTVPKQWTTWLRSVTYWHADLDED